MTGEQDRVGVCVCLRIHEENCVRERESKNASYVCKDYSFFFVLTDTLSQEDSCKRYIMLYVLVGVVSGPRLPNAYKDTATHADRLTRPSNAEPLHTYTPSERRIHMQAQSVQM